MRIKLVRTGGFIPIIKKAETEVNISDQELATLIGLIQSDASAPRIKDGNSWELTAGDIVINVDPEKVPDEYRELFDKLKQDLKIVK
jgi:hypothetical protein